VQRLRNLELIEDRGERFGLTALGRGRYEHLHEAIGDGSGNAVDGEGKVARSLRIFAKDMLK
jgi:hypothetical protein